MSFKRDYYNLCKNLFILDFDRIYGQRKFRSEKIKSNEFYLLLTDHKQHANDHVEKLYFRKTLFN